MSIAELALIFILLHSANAILETYKATFYTTKPKQYIRLEETIPKPLKELTLCYWARPLEDSPKATMAIFSYSVTTRPDELLAGISINKAGGEAIFNRQTKESTYTTQWKSWKSESFRLGFWVHVCFKWSSYTGGYNISLNGMPISEGDNFPKQQVDPNGMVILGLDQDVYGGDFSLDEAFLGELSEVQLWDYLLGDDDILNLWKCKLNQEGNVLSWSKVGKVVYGGISLSLAHIPCGC